MIFWKNYVYNISEPIRNPIYIKRDIFSIMFISIDDDVFVGEQMIMPLFFKGNKNFDSKKSR